MAKNKYPDWKDYEKQIYSIISKEFATETVVMNHHIEGALSKSKRQIDVCVFNDSIESPFLGIVECKYLGRKITVTIIDGIIGKMKDVNASIGIVYTEVGFSKGAERLARSANIEFRKVAFEYLKDFDFMHANILPDIFIQEMEYAALYCNKCEITNLYEIKIVRGFCETEDIICPKCKTSHHETRTDGGYRVIKRLDAKIITEAQVDGLIVEHLLKTRESWDRKFSIFQESAIDERIFCAICSKKFDLNCFGSHPTQHQGYYVCRECVMSNRTLLIDYGKI